MIPLHRYILLWQEQKNPISTHRPPVTSSVWPVTYEASGDAKLPHPKSTGELLPIDAGRDETNAQKHRSGRLVRGARTG
jgi:hypothetical protein